MGIVIDATDKFKARQVRELINTCQVHEPSEREKKLMAALERNNNGSSTRIK